MAKVKFEWIGVKEYKEKLLSLALARTSFHKEYLDILGEVALTMIKQVAPKNTGEYANSWSIVERGEKHIVIDTSMPELFDYLEHGTKPHIIKPVDADALLLPSFQYGKFFKRVNHPGTKPQPHIGRVSIALNEIMKDTMRSQMKKHSKLFRHISSRSGMPKTSNITKTVGLTGTTVSSLRGRGIITLTKIRTGRKMFKRRLGKRRRTGMRIKKASAE